MARIARLDCPERWPDLLPHLTKVTIGYANEGGGLLWTHTNLHAHTHAHAHTHTLTCMHAHTHMHTRMHTHTCTHACTRTHAHTHAHTHTRARTHVQGVQSANPLLQKCSLNAMKHVIKTLAGRRLAPQRKAFYAITMSLFVYLAKLWTTYLQESLSQLSSAEWLDSALLSLEMSRTCLKSMYVHVGDVE